MFLDQQELLVSLGSRVEELEAAVLKSERSSKRQAAPFRREESELKEKKSRPGRKGGHRGSYRSTPDQIDQIHEVSMPEECPYCSGVIGSVEPVEQIIEELPELRPEVIKLITYKGVCHRCKRVVRTHHPLQLGHATGSAKVQLGRRASGLVLSLQHRYGLPKRKVSRLLKEVLGLSLTPGGVVHLTHRLAGKLQGEYDQLFKQARQSDHIHSDETSWYVANPKHWLWVFTNDQLTLYRVDKSRGRQVVHQVLGTDYQGVLISDCLAIYDDASEIQHKCYAHHLKELSRLIKLSGKDPPSAYLLKWKQLFRVAMMLKERKAQLSEQRFVHHCLALLARVNLLLEQPREDQHEAYFANRMEKQRDHLFTFLHYDKVGPTNNLAERQLRPAVIARKVSCGNRTDKGANSWQIIASIQATAIQLKQDFYLKVDQAITQHLNILKANEALPGIGPLDANRFSLI